MTIRNAAPQDFGNVLKLIMEFSAFQRSEEKVTISLQQLLNDEQIFHCLIAETDDKEVIGFASYFFAYYSWTGKALYLDDLYVKAAYRKQGTGKKLLEAVIQLATEQDCKKVRWQVSKWNTQAIGFYESIGAHIDETEINCDYIIRQQ